MKQDVLNVILINLFILEKDNLTLLQIYVIVYKDIIMK